MKIIKTMNTVNRILFIIIIQTLILFSIIAFRQWTLNTGTLITLETAPIDPRSLFSGDYVILNYKISQVPAGKELIDKVKQNETVYVVLKPSGSYWVAESIETSKLTLSPPMIAVKALVNYKDATNVYLKYGIENYFIPEGEGKKFENVKLGKNISVKVAVDRFGNAAIASVLIDNKEIYQEKLF